jgi:hypothetical protein
MQSFFFPVRGGGFELLVSVWLRVVSFPRSKKTVKCAMDAGCKLC